MISPYRIPIQHSVESGDFVDTHRGHVEDVGDLVHDANAAPTVLALAEVE